MYSPIHSTINTFLFAFLSRPFAACVLRLQVPVCTVATRRFRSPGATCSIAALFWYNKWIKKILKELQLVPKCIWTSVTSSADAWRCFASWHDALTVDSMKSSAICSNNSSTSSSSCSFGSTSLTKSCNLPLVRTFKRYLISIIVLLLTFSMLFYLIFGIARGSRVVGIRNIWMGIGLRHFMRLQM